MSHITIKIYNKYIFLELYSNFIIIILIRSIDIYVI